MVKRKGNKFERSGLIYGFTQNKTPPALSEKPTRCSKMINKIKNNTGIELSNPKNASDKIFDISAGIIMELSFFVIFLQFFLG
jgi:hypothetical protein